MIYPLFCVFWKCKLEFAPKLFDRCNNLSALLPKIPTGPLAILNLIALKA